MMTDAILLHDCRLAKALGSVKFDMKEYERNMTGQFELN